MNRSELWDKVVRCQLQQHFRLLVALCLRPNALLLLGPVISPLYINYYYVFCI